MKIVWVLSMIIFGIYSQDIINIDMSKSIGNTIFIGIVDSKCKSGFLFQSNLKKFDSLTGKCISRCKVMTSPECIAAVMEKTDENQFKCYHKSSTSFDIIQTSPGSILFCKHKCKSLILNEFYNFIFIY